jgi:hypothetical protein
MQGTIVRKAELDDVFDVLVLCNAFCKESPRQYGKFNNKKTQANLEGAITSDNTEIFVLEKDGEIVGMLAGLITAHLFSDVTMATELAMFITKEHRGGMAFARLIKAYEAWAIENQTDIICMSDITEIQDLEKAYNRLGYYKVESSYCKEI